ncbi:hypothetical protein EMCRGX_G009900 [Ephydatia muelleri]|eukprot:Em0003g1223a
MSVRKEMANVSSDMQMLEVVYASLPCREEDYKYAIEAYRLQFQFATLQPNIVHQLIGEEICESHGGKGRNLPCDLHNEHVNRLYKQIYQTWSASTRAARAVSSFERLALGFVRQTGIHPEETDHSRKSDAKDVQIVVEVVLKARILEN